VGLAERLLGTRAGSGPNGATGSGNRAGNGTDIAAGNGPNGANAAAAGNAAGNGPDSANAAANATRNAAGKTTCNATGIGTDIAAHLSVVAPPTCADRARGNPNARSQNGATLVERTHGFSMDRGQI
jgi:hypothetical protein